MKVIIGTDEIAKIEKKKIIIDNVFGFNEEERKLLNHLFTIFLERIAVKEKTYIFLDKDREKSNLMFMYITCLYVNYKSIGEADLTFSNTDEIKDEVFDFVFKLTDMLDDVPSGNKPSIACREDGYLLYLS